MNQQSLKSLLISTLVVAAVAFGSSVTIPHTFTPGTTAFSSDVNANFAAIKTAVDDNDVRITAMQTAPVYIPVNPVNGAEPAFFSGWSNVGYGFMPAAITKDALGFVHFRGLIKSPNGNGLIFSVPPGYRPTATLQFPARCGNNTMCAVMVDINGNVSFYAAAPGYASNSLTLDGIIYDPR